MRALALLLGEAARQWNNHRSPRAGAALSYYAVFSLAPLAILTLSLTSLVVERNAARAELVGQVRAIMSNETADMVATILAETAAPDTTLWAAILGALVLMVGASGVFGELQDSLNQIWDVTTLRHPVLVLIRERIISFLMVLMMSVLMLASFLISAITALAGRYAIGLSPGLTSIWELGNAGVSLVVTTLLFALIYRVVPDAPVQWRDVWAGALVASLLFVAGKWVLSFYFGLSALGSHYGAAGSLMIVLAWIYYCAQILLYGAEITRAYAFQHGSRKVGAPKATAER